MFKDLLDDKDVRALFALYEKFIARPLDNKEQAVECLNDVADKNTQLVHALTSGRVEVLLDRFENLSRITMTSEGVFHGFQFKINNRQSGASYGVPQLTFFLRTALVLRVFAKGKKHCDQSSVADFLDAAKQSTHMEMWNKTNNTFIELRQELTDTIIEANRCAEQMGVEVDWKTKVASRLAFLSPALIDMLTSWSGAIRNFHISSSFGVPSQNCFHEDPSRRAQGPRRPKGSGATG